VYGKGLQMMTFQGCDWHFATYSWCPDIALCTFIVVAAHSWRYL